MTRSVEVFGTLRSFIFDGECRLQLADSSLPEEVREALVAFARAREHVTSGLRAILDRSVIAADDRILREDEPIGNGAILAILPPVCGG